MRRMESVTPWPLVAFLKSTPFAAVSTTVADCIMAIPTAMVAPSLAILRGHPNNEQIQLLSCSRLRGMLSWNNNHSVGHSDRDACVTSAEVEANVADIVGAGGVEALCATLRRHSSVCKLAGEVCALLRLLALGDGEWRCSARAALLRAGLCELVCPVVAIHTSERIPMLASAFFLLGAMSAAQLESGQWGTPLGISSHFDFETVTHVTSAVVAFPANIELQFACCSLMAALSRRSDELLNCVADRGGALAAVDAIRRFRSGGPLTSKLHASALAVLGALASNVRARRDCERAGGIDMICSTINYWSDDAENDSVVHLCGWRALLSFLEPKASTLSTLSFSSVESHILHHLWESLYRHRRRAHVVATCAEVLYSLLSEDVRRATGGRRDLIVLSSSERAQATFGRVVAALDDYESNTQALRAFYLSAQAIISVQMAIFDANKERLFARGDLRCLKQRLEKISASLNIDMGLNSSLDRAFQQLDWLDQILIKQQSSSET